MGRAARRYGRRHRRGRVDRPAAATYRGRQRDALGATAVVASALLHSVAVVIVVALVVRAPRERIVPPVPVALATDLGTGGREAGESVASRESPAGAPVPAPFSTTLRAAAEAPPAARAAPSPEFLQVPRILPPVAPTRLLKVPRVLPPPPAPLPLFDPPGAEHAVSVSRLADPLPRLAELELPGVRRGQVAGSSLPSAPATPEARDPLPAGSIGATDQPQRVDGLPFEDLASLDRAVPLEPSPHAAVWVPPPREGDGGDAGLGVRVAPDLLGVARTGEPPAPLASGPGAWPSVAASARIHVASGSDPDRVLQEPGGLAGVPEPHAPPGRARAPEPSGDRPSGEPRQPPDEPRDHPPRTRASGIIITSPVDGAALSAEAPPLVLVEGRVADPTPGVVDLVANGRRFAARVHQGRFRHVLPLFAPALHLWAETPSNGLPPRRSEAVTVRGAPLPRAVGVLVIDWPSSSARIGAELRADWRERPDRPDDPTQALPLRGLESDLAAVPTEAFYLSPMKSGVYAFILRHGGVVSPVRVRPTLYLSVGTALQAHELEPVTLDGAGQTVLTKILMPYGVRWEQAEWFTGQSATADAVTKFRFPEGLTWTERRARGRPAARGVGGDP